MKEGAKYSVKLTVCGVLAALYATAMASSASAAGTLSLDGAWKLDFFPQPDAGAVRTLPLPEGLDVKRVTATVPGNCELDLVNAGLLPAPEIGLNAREFRKCEGYQWLYSRTFDHSPKGDASSVFLVFDGVDTLADIFLNGEKIGETENMFIPHRFDITRKVKKGKNTVQVLLRSVLLDSRGKTIGALGRTMSGGAEGEPYRKAGHMGGWDIFPRLFVSGLWRGVRVETQGKVHIDQTSWIVKRLDVERRTASIVGSCRIRMPFDMLGRARMRIGLKRGGKVVFEKTRSADFFHPSFSIGVSNADFWWPNGFGEPALYEAYIGILGEDGSVLAEHRERIGIRTIELVRDDVYGPDRPGQFLFKVNGTPVYIRGSNWVPLDALHGRDRRHLVPTLELFKDLNCNMIRVWGGGVYEPKEFFDWCDGNGMLVWQDFMTGCSMFPFDPEYQRQTRKEALSVVLGFRNHPSLALWSGNNENDLATRWRLGGDPSIIWDPNDDITSRVTLPQVVQEFDPSRPYLPSSPYVSPAVAARKARPSENHLWGARAYYKVAYYTNSPCWFASEMGYHGCPNRSSIERMMTPQAVYPWTEVTGKDPFKDYRWNREWQFKASDPWLKGFGRRRNSLMTNQIKIMFGGVTTDLDTFIAQSQFVQAEAMKTFCELFRSRKFTRMNGLVWWNVRDGWPQISDAVVDYYGGKKRAYFALRNAQQNQIVCMVDDHTAWAVNDTLRPVEGRARFTDAETGQVLMEKDFTIPSNGKLDLGKVPFSGQGVILIDATLDGKPYRNHFLYGEPPFDWADVCRWMSRIDK